MNALQVETYILCIHNIVFLSITIVYKRKMRISAVFFCKFYQFHERFLRISAVFLNRKDFVIYMQVYDKAFEIRL